MIRVMVDHIRFISSALIPLNNDLPLFTLPILTISYD